MEAALHIINHWLLRVILGSKVYSRRVKKGVFNIERGEWSTLYIVMTVLAREWWWFSQGSWLGKKLHSLLIHSYIREWRIIFDSSVGLAVMQLVVLHQCKSTRYVMLRSYHHCFDTSLWCIWCTNCILEGGCMYRFMIYDQCHTQLSYYCIPFPSSCQALLLQVKCCIWL